MSTGSTKWGDLLNDCMAKASRSPITATISYPPNTVEQVDEALRLISIGALRKARLEPGQFHVDEKLGFEIGAFLACDFDFLDYAPVDDEAPAAATQHPQFEARPGERLTNLLAALRAANDERPITRIAVDACEPDLLHEAPR